MIDMSFNYDDPWIRTHMYEGNFGLEKESLRVDLNGFLSQTKHPFVDDPNIEKDFCENQIELITNVCDSVDSVWYQLENLHKRAVRTLLHLETGKEILWPFSNPPYVKDEKDIPIANYEGNLKGKERYREYLASKYGKKKMLFSGIHFNFSFSDAMLKEGYKKSHFKMYKEYKNSIYLELSKKVTRYSWFIVYLTAASPVMDGSFFENDWIDKDILKNYASTRCSEIGYWNDFIPLLEYKDLESYIQSIQNYVSNGQLNAASELYYPVRLKPVGENSLENLKNSGVNHIELRMLDINPLSPIGIMKEDILFLHLFILYLMSLEDTYFETYEQIMAIKNEKRAAEYEEKNIWIENDWNSKIPVREAADEILLAMEAFYDRYADQDILELILYQKSKIIFPEKQYAVRIREAFQHEYVKKGLELAKSYAKNIEKEVKVNV